jgi:hypothetical protein
VRENFRAVDPFPGDFFIPMVVMTLDAVRSVAPRAIDLLVLSSSYNQF